MREKEFVSDAGHELRTPLTVIRTSAELLLASDGMTEKAQAKLRNILTAADKMDRLSS
ncbi:MAG: histidine kinase dimerization/phospho-acceptor domain-containing protein [Patescibacteria group bacterium]